MYRRKSFSSLILLVLEKSIDGAVKLHDFAKNPGFYVYWNGWEYPLDKSALSKTLKRLREKGLVDIIGDNEIILKLTDKGREKAILAKMLLDDAKWDGIWRIIIFDVPEKRRLARDVLRSKLKNWGFIPWQQSVWVTRKNCTKLLKEFINQAGIKSWVKIFEAEEIDI